MTKFTQITDVLKYPKDKKNKFIDYHSIIIEYVVKDFSNTSRYKRRVIDAMNSISYVLLNGDSIPDSWNKSSPLNISLDIDQIDISSYLEDQNLYIDLSQIIWDVEDHVKDSSMKISQDESCEVPLVSEKVSSEVISGTAHVDSIPSIAITSSQEDTGDLIALQKVATPYRDEETQKTDLYIQNPTVPRIDTSKIYASGKDGADNLVIYYTLPKVPTRQCDISLTTDLNNFTDSDLRRLYPKQFIPTRAKSMYEPVDGLTFHSQLGVIFPIEGFTEDQVLDNIVRYPHIYKLQKYDEYGSRITFYSTIEVDSKLVKLKNIWKEQIDTARIPMTKDFIKEYSVRRYLLERDINHIEHKYSMVGDLSPFLTLFTIAEDYATFGYTDEVELARQCVLSRVKYRRTRNPVLRRLMNV